MSKLKALLERARHRFENMNAHVSRLIVGFCAMLALLSVITLCIVFPGFGSLLLILFGLAMVSLLAYLIGAFIEDVRSC